MQEQDLSQYDILIVDDVPVNQVLVEKMLERFHFTVRKAGNGLEAMREIIAKKPDLVLLDLIMPLMDGFEVLEYVQRDPALRDVKVIVLSALNTNDDIVRAYNAGARDFITKPILYGKLLNSVSKQLGL